MGTEHRHGDRRPGRRAPRAAGAALSAVALLITGCATMPAEGDVRRVDSSPRADAESQVRVFGMSPRDGEQPSQIVRGFLEATTSDEPDFATARDYLTPGEAKRWDPFARTTVLDGAPKVFPQGRSTAGPERTDYTVEVTGALVAAVDDRHAYTPSRGTYQEDFHLVQVRGQWRIDHLPDGLVLAESDFQRIYRSLNTYYYADLGPDTGAVARGREVLVADPVYLRRRIDPVTELVDALLDGPTTWLDPVVTSSFPEGTRLARGERLTLDDSGALTVPLSRGRAGRQERPILVDPQQCDRMAAQLLHTVDSQASARVTAVRLTLGAGGRELCDQTREQAQAYGPGRLNGSALYHYFVDDGSRLVRLAEEDDRAVPVSGPFGTGRVQMRAVAVSRDEGRGAGVSLGGQALFIAPLSDGVPLGPPVLSSDAPRERDRLTAPSWDGLGDLWVADRDPAGPRLLRLRGGREEPREVPVTGLGDGRIEALRVSSDGLRIAMLVSEDDRTTLRLGRIERNDVGGRSEAAVTGLRPITPQLEDVVAASWAGGSRLVIVGRATGGVQQLRYVATDGSVANPPTLPGLNEVLAVAASEDEEKPLLADTNEGIARLSRDAEWELVAEKGSAPVHPG